MAHSLYLHFLWVIILMYIDWIGTIKDGELCFLLKTTLRRIKSQKTKMIDILLLQFLQTSNKKTIATRQNGIWFLF